MCSPNQALLVIKCCGEVLVDLDRKSRGQIAEKCFSLILSLKNTPLDITHYNALLKVRLLLNITDNPIAVFMLRSTTRTDTR